MKMRSSHSLVLLYVAVSAFLFLPGKSSAISISSYEDFAASYLDYRDWTHPILPSPLPVSLDDVEKMLLDNDYSFQQYSDWYAPNSAGPFTYASKSEIDKAVKDGDWLGVYEDMSRNLILVVNENGKELASFWAPYWPDLSGKNAVEYDWLLTSELNKRRITYWARFSNYTAPPSLQAQALPYGGGMMMSMGSGGTNQLEVTGMKLTNDEVYVTVAWPTTFTNRIDVFSIDTSELAGLGNWTMVDNALITTGTNELMWADTGPDTGVRIYSVGASAEVDGDSDGYGDAYEQFVLGTDPDNGDTDGDGVSDGPFDPDGGSSIVFGPDAFPLDDAATTDTDGDGMPDSLSGSSSLTEDDDDDNDGIPDASDPEPLIPGIVAPFKVVSVVNTNPPGADSGTEVFDVSSAGRMLPYAKGSDAFNGFGRLFGGIYFNHDGTNLYVGVAGYSKTETTDGEDALLIVLDTKSGGVNGLDAITSGPKGLSKADNLRFLSGTFVPDVAILLGNRHVDE